MDACGWVVAKTFRAAGEVSGRVYTLHFCAVAGRPPLPAGEGKFFAADGRAASRVGRGVYRIGHDGELLRSSDPEAP